MINHNEIGMAAEQAVARIYAKRNFKIIAKNYHVYMGRKIAEIDLIVKKNDCLRFVEVKARSSHSYGTGLEAVDLAKKQRIIFAAKCFLVSSVAVNVIQSFPSLHFDVAVVQLRSFDKKIQKITIYSDVIEESR